MFYEPGDVRMEDVPAPKPGPGDVLVRIGAALTCGTDVQTFKRGHPTLIKEVPSPFGHEFGGTIEAVGEGVEEWRPGMRVVAANSAPCNRCYYCKVGDQSMCENLSFLNGAFAEYIVVPARIVGQNLYEIPGGVEYSRAALLEPLACAVHGIVRTPISMGDTVAVIGAGQIGLMFVRLATERGARVICVDKSSDRLAVARELGAEETIEAAEGVDTIEAVREWTPASRRADRVIEAVGLPELWEQALQMVRKGGDVTLFGGAPSGTNFEVDTVLLHYSQITIRGIFHHTPYTVQVAFDLLKSGRLDPEPFISGVRPLEDVVEALEQHGRQEGIKYEIQPPDGGPLEAPRLARGSIPRRQTAHRFRTGDGNVGQRQRPHSGRRCPRNAQRGRLRGARTRGGGARRCGRISPGGLPRAFQRDAHAHGHLPRACRCGRRGPHAFHLRDHAGLPGMAHTSGSLHAHHAFGGRGDPARSLYDLRDREASHLRERRPGREP